MCGVFGAYSKSDNVGEEVYLALLALQHRGQESAGVAWIDGEGHMNVTKRMGLVNEALDQEELAELSARSMIGHVRYPTSGAAVNQNSQPIGANYAQGPIAVAHNGNITNYHELRDVLEKRGAIFQSTCDSEVILHLLSHQPSRSPLDALKRAMPSVHGAYSLVALIEEGLVAVRDPWGFRPLSLGRRGDNWYVASETCAFTLLGVSPVRDVEPGEIVVINDRGLTSYKMPSRPARKMLCSFEFVYLARPDSVINGISVYEARKEMGRRLARSSGSTVSLSDADPAHADFVTTLPDSGTTAALGYAQASGLEYEGAVVRNRYVGRTFIQPTQKVREIGVRTKLSPSDAMLRGKSVVLVDDSIVRGTTAGLVVSMIRGCGASAIHLSISSPPVKCPCYYGIDTPSRGELAAASHTLEEIASSVGADTLRYISQQDMIDAIGMPQDALCTACFDGRYVDEPSSFAKPDATTLDFLD